MNNNLSMIVPLVLIFQGVNHVYKPTPSKLKVDDPFCAALHADLPGSNPQYPRREPHQCHYKIGYVDGTSEGVLANDTFSLSEGNNKPIVFGYDTN
jgi:hypothetical protein